MSSSLFITLLILSATSLVILDCLWLKIVSRCFLVLTASSYPFLNEEWFVSTDLGPLDEPLVELPVLDLIWAWEVVNRSSRLDLSLLLLRFRVETEGAGFFRGSSRAGVSISGLNWRVYSVRLIWLFSNSVTLVSKFLFFFRKFFSILSLFLEYCINLSTISGVLLIRSWIFSGESFNSERTLVDVL